MLLLYILITLFLLMGIILGYKWMRENRERMNELEEHNRRIKQLMEEADETN